MTLTCWHPLLMIPSNSWRPMGLLLTIITGLWIHTRFAMVSTSQRTCIRFAYIFCLVKCSSNKCGSTPIPSVIDQSLPCAIVEEELCSLPTLHSSVLLNFWYLLLDILV